MLESRSSFGCCVLDNNVYVVSGWGRGGARNANAERYNPSTGVWTALPPLKTARNGLALCAFDGSLYAFGGVDGLDMSTSSVERFDVANNEWRYV
jgi:hypothetical protein